MATCVTCGAELHPERAERYDYCTKPECRARNADRLSIVAVGVNKASDQFVVLNERTRQEMSSGRYKKQPEAGGSVRSRSRAQTARTAQPAPVLVPRSSAGTRPQWSEAQENLALTYRAMGMNPEQIAKRLGVSPSLVTRILLSRRAQRR